MEPWHGVLAPVGTPKEIVDRLNVEINRIMTSQDVQKKLGDIGMEVAAITPQEFSSNTDSDFNRASLILVGSVVRVKR